MDNDAAILATGGDDDHKESMQQWLDTNESTSADFAGTCAGERGIDCEEGFASRFYSTCLREFQQLCRQEQKGCSLNTPQLLHPTIVTEIQNEQPLGTTSHHYSRKSVAMNPNNCNHHWSSIKATSDLLQWSCQRCHSGPHWFIQQCQNCEARYCGRCTQKVGGSHTVRIRLLRMSLFSRHCLAT